MKRTACWILGAALASLLLVAAMQAQAPEKGEGESASRVPTIEELEVLVETLPAPGVLIDPFDARNALQEMLDSADDEEIVFLYYRLRKDKAEYAELRRDLAELSARIAETRARREGRSMR